MIYQTTTPVRSYILGPSRQILSMDYFLGFGPVDTFSGRGRIFSGTPSSTSFLWCLTGIRSLSRDLERALLDIPRCLASSTKVFPRFVCCHILKAILLPSGGSPGEDSCQVPTIWLQSWNNPFTSSPPKNTCIAGEFASDPIAGGRPPGWPKTTQ